MHACKHAADPIGCTGTGMICIEEFSMDAKEYVGKAIDAEGTFRFTVCSSMSPAATREREDDHEKIWQMRHRVRAHLRSQVWLEFYLGC